MASFLLSAGLLLVTAAEARSFVPVGANHGLDARIVSSMLVDRSGFLWVGSREGLYRFDGYHARLFEPDPANAQAICDSDVRQVFEDSRGFIWVATASGGLDRYEPSSGTFSRLRHDPDDVKSIPEGVVTAIMEGPNDGLWVATSGALSRFDRQTRGFTHFRHDPEDPASLSDNRVISLHLSAAGRLWVGTYGGGVNLWSPSAGSFMQFDLAKLGGGAAVTNRALSLYEDEDGWLWVGTAEGLIRLDASNGRAESIDLGTESGFPPAINAIAAESGRLWLGTRARGVLILDRESRSWKAASEQPLGTSGSLPTDALKSLVMGAGQVFVGTWGSGVYRSSLEEPGFSVLDMRTAAELGNDVISAVMATAETGRPWVGTFGGGPRRVNVREGTVSSMPLKRHGMRESGVLSLAGPIMSRIYAATAEGLYEFSQDSIQVSLYRHDPLVPGGIAEGQVTALLQSGTSGLWIGMGGSGLHYFDTTALRFEHLRHDSGRADSLSGNFVTALLAEEDTHLWVGTRAAGLNRCAIADGSCERFVPKSRAAGGISHQHVTSLFRDRRGRVWVGTDGGGLNRVVQDESGQVVEFLHWGREDGLLGDGILAIQEDRDESLWLSTRQGLSRLNGATGEVRNFSASSGLSVSHFNANASAADEEFIYFGSTNGLLSIRRGTLLQARKPSSVRLTSVRHARVGGEPSYVPTGVGSLRLPHGEMVSITTAVLDYSESEHEYAYRLHDGDPWIDVGAQGQVVFNSLAPGSYEFQARGRDANGIWGESEVLELEVVPPFWMTNWFKGLLFVLLLLLYVVIHRARIAVLKRRANEMLRLGEKREKALEEQLGGQSELAVLTPRQKEILQLIAEGNATREIAERLGVSVKTVEAHRANLMERLEIYDVPGLVRLAIRSRLISLES
jgi:ligand-binding sensor domain-containing protein/DNA-binding CsgD family transcriptional regulator